MCVVKEAEIRRAMEGGRVRAWVLEGARGEMEGVHVHGLGSVSNLPRDEFVSFFVKLKNHQ